MKENKPLVCVAMGSASDADVMKGCTETLEALGIPCEVRVISAHRTPERTREVTETAFTSIYHTGSMVPVLAYGPGSEAFGGIYENTFIGRTLISYLGGPPVD